MTKIKGWKQECVEVEIDDKEVRGLVREYILKLLNIPSYDWYTIDKGFFIGHTDHGGHGSGYVEETKIRKAIAQDVEFVSIFDRLYLND